jgi:DNA-directed RNA polymerase specialized sigma24 family protein
MAQRLGVSRHAIEHRLGRARQRLRQILIQTGVAEATS